MNFKVIEDITLFECVLRIIWAVCAVITLGNTIAMGWWLFGYFTGGY